LAIVDLHGLLGKSTLARSTALDPFHPLRVGHGQRGYSDRSKFQDNDGGEHTTTRSGPGIDWSARNLFGGVRSWEKSRGDGLWLFVWKYLLVSGSHSTHYMLLILD
jgi:hypothetical protein